MSTPHIGAKKGEFAKTVIMPGDPKRVEYIARKFIDNAKLISSIRGIPAYTGTYKGKKVSVMASGMGNASMGIYSYELFKFYNIQNIIRVGTCGVYDTAYHLGSVAIAEQTISRTNYASLLEKANKAGKENAEIKANSELIKKAKNTAKKLGTEVACGNFYCTDTFYNDEHQEGIVNKYKCIGVEMETAALYSNALALNKKALALCSISDNIVTGEQLTPQEREQTLDKMIVLALEMAE